MLRHTRFNPAQPAAFYQQQVPAQSLHRLRVAFLLCSRCQTCDRGVAQQRIAPLRQQRGLRVELGQIDPDADQHVGKMRRTPFDPLFATRAQQCSLQLRREMAGHIRPRHRPFGLFGQQHLRMGGNDRALRAKTISGKIGKDQIICVAYHPRLPFTQFTIARNTVTMCRHLSTRFQTRPEELVSVLGGRLQKRAKGHPQGRLHSADCRVRRQ